MTRPSLRVQILARDNPGPWWLLSLLFIGVGSAFVYLGLAQSTAIPAWQGPLAAGMGLVGLAVGIWWGWRSPLSVVAVHPGPQTLVLTQIGLFGRRLRTIPLTEIEDVIAEYLPDDEGATMARPVLALRDGSRLPLSALWRHDPQGVAKAVAAIKVGLSGSRG